jgi:hypothetical protein
MKRVRIIVPLAAFCTALAVLMLGMPTAATAASANYGSSCHGTIKVGGVAKPFTKAASTIVNTTAFTFVGTEQDVEDGATVTFSFTGGFGPGPGPVPGGTFTTVQHACTSCAVGTCHGISGCKPLVAHAELATQTFEGVSKSAMASADFQMVPNTPLGTAAGTMLCTSAKSP